MTRYNAGETLASIARTYDCSPPAISYIVSRSKERQPDNALPPNPPAAEVQLVKAAASEPALGVIRAPVTNGSGGNGQSHPAAPAVADHRPTLHLSLGNPSPGNGATMTPEPRAVEPPPAPPVTGFAEARPAFIAPAQRNNGERKEGNGVFIDKDLRARVDSDINAFLAAFDAALSEDTEQSRSALREATDRLLRAGARTRIELERLEARLPLPRRDTAARDEPVWRR